MKANHLIAVMSMFFIFSAFLLAAFYNFPDLILGALIVWGGQIVTFYFRKAKKE